MATFHKIPRSEMPSLLLPCESCGLLVERTHRHQGRLESSRRGRGAVFCSRQCHGAWLGSRNRK